MAFGSRKNEPVHVGDPVKPHPHSAPDLPVGVGPGKVLGGQSLVAGANITLTQTGPSTLEIAAAGGGGGGARATFVLRPGGVADPANGVYITWATVHAAAVAAEGEKLISIEPITPATAVAIGPAAAYDMYGITLQGQVEDSALQRTILTIADGVTFTNWSGNTPWCQVDFMGTVIPLFTVDTGGAGDPYTMQSGVNTIWRARGTVEMILVTNDSVLKFYLGDYAQVGNVDAAGFETFNMDALFCSTNFRVGGQVDIFVNSLRGLGSADAEIIGGQSTEGSLSTTQVNLANPFTVFGTQTFTATVPGDWVAPPPVNNADAINRLAAFTQAMDAALAAAAVAGFPLGPIP